MPAWTLALLLAATTPNVAVPQNRNTLSLYRGAPLAGQAIRYWSVTDTVLDSSKPDGNFGGESYLGGGQGRVILIDFGDLRRALGPNQKITRASILLSITGGNPVPLAQASEILVPWGEGPTQVVSYAATPASVTAPTWSATWKHRRAGQDAIAWQQPGASGVGDAKVLPDVKAISPDNDHVLIDGLGPALQRQYERPHDFHGFALTFSGTIEFSSSQAKTGRPVLVVEYEPQEPAKGADLAVVRIARAPEYPRYSESSQPNKVTQDGEEVIPPADPSNLKEKHWPDNGEEVTYTAIVKNLGDAPSTGYVARWLQREKPGSAVESDRSLAPGEETTLTIKVPFKNVHSDHRLQPLGLKLEPKGADANSYNNALAIQEGALAVRLWITPLEANAIRNQRPWGESTPEGWAQALIALWNDTIFPQSRFSFAPDGVLERLRLQSVRVDGQSRSADTFPGEWDVTISSYAGPAEMKDLLKGIGNQLGLTDLGATSFTAGSKTVTIGSSVLERGSADLYPGLMGGGDTRNESFVPPLLTLPFEPASNPIFDVLPIEATDLLSATDVAALNGALGHRRGFVSEALYNLPATVLVRVLDQAGNPVKNATIEIFPMVNGAIRTAQPLGTTQTGPTGIASLPNRATQLPETYKTPLGKTLPPNPFGAIDPSGSNGLILLKVNAGGNADYAFVKAWQLADAFRRNPTPAMVFDVRVSVGGDVDRTQNLAKNRIVSDSANQLPAKLAGLVDEKLETAVEFPAGKGAWIELDLGRDRAFGELNLVSDGPFWERFAVMAYATGQTSTEAKQMTQEAAWSWTFANRSNSEQGNSRSVAYRTAGIRARFIRIVRLTDGPAGRLTEIRVHPLRGP